MGVPDEEKSTGHLIRTHTRPVLCKHSKFYAHDNAATTTLARTTRSMAQFFGPEGCPALYASRPFLSDAPHGRTATLRKLFRTAS